MLNAHSSSSLSVSYPVRTKCGNAPYVIAIDAYGGTENVCILCSLRKIVTPTQVFIILVGVSLSSKESNARYISRVLSRICDLHFISSEPSSIRLQLER